MNLAPRRRHETLGMYIGCAVYFYRLGSVVDFWSNKDASAGLKAALAQARSKRPKHDKERV